MPKYRARVSITLPYKQRYSSISVSSEAELEGEDLDALRDEVTAFVLRDVQGLMDRAMTGEDHEEEAEEKPSGPRRTIKKKTSP